jgi:cytochrome c556
LRFSPHNDIQPEETLPMKKIALCILCAAVAAPALAQQPLKIEDQIKLRRAAYNMMALGFGDLAAMAQDKKPFDKEQAEHDADLAKIVSTIPRRFFPEGSDKDTKAKPEIWKNRADFDSKMDKMISEVAKLPAAVRGGDMAAFKAQVGETGKACKACHDEYRAK